MVRVSIVIVIGVALYRIRIPIGLFFWRGTRRMARARTFSAYFVQVRSWFKHWKKSALGWTKKKNIL